ISQKKRYYEEMELLSDELADMEPDFVCSDTKFDRLYDFILRNQEYLEQVREAYQAQIDLVQNNTMKTLTVVTMIFLPLQLITGWFGMNLIMPEFEWTYGYPYVICLSLFILLVEILFFRWRKWF
ncbi:MAG: magnesium transporter, partial [Clostridia bacterium]|nr:magnesium transporter [Clostridia bacterium]